MLGIYENTPSIGYCICYGESKVILESSIVKYLDIDYDKYIDILIKYGAYNLGRESKSYWFKTREDCKRCINSEELLPYMLILILLR